MTVKELEDVGLLQEVIVEKKKNAHSICKAGLFISDEYMLSELNGKLGADACVEDDERIYMRGTIREIAYDKTFSGSKAVVTIVSYSDKADAKKNNRVFQNTKKRYRDIINGIHSDGVCFQITDSDLLNLEEPLLILQAGQTDFEFVHAIARNCGREIFVNDTDSRGIVNIGYNCGPARRDLAPGKVILYSAEIDEACIKLHVKTHEYLEFGRMTYFEGDPYIVTAVTAEYKNGALNFSHTLERKLKDTAVKEYASGWLGRAKVTDNADPDNLGRIQVSFLEYEESETENRMWLPYIPCLTEREQGMALIPGIDEIVNVFCENGRCYSDGCIREKAFSEKIKNVENRTVMFRDKSMSFAEDKVEIEAFSYKITVEDRGFTLQNDDNTIRVEKDRIFVKNKSTVDIKAEQIHLDGSSKISAKTSAFDVG